MEIIQFEDKSLSHFSYAIISDGEMAVIDPERNPYKYYELAKDQNAKIKAVFETHPHADFISSHKEISEATGGKIYVSKILGAEYEHTTFDDGETVRLGKITLQAINTPGHSPDSICILAFNEEGREEAVFTGDTLFIGDCGRPDLRETAGKVTGKREELARQMYHSLRDKLATLPDDVIVYPAHGAGSLCGKGLSAANSSTIGAEKASNWSMQNLTEDEFVHQLLADQPFVPRYFTNSVEMNKRGAVPYRTYVDSIDVTEGLPAKFEKYVIVDTRNQADFKKGHLPKSINLMNDTKFETWLGSVISPGEPFYLIGESKDEVERLIERIAKIGYEGEIMGAYAVKEIEGLEEPVADINYFRNALDEYTIVDIRNTTEVKSKPVFENAINIPLHTLRERVREIPTQKPIMVHCAGGYRSAAGASIIKNEIDVPVEVLDLSYGIKQFN